MHKFKIAALATVAALGLASMPASAAVINLSGVSTAQSNVQTAAVDQVAASVNINVGSQVASVVDQSATAVNNVATATTDVTQDSFLGLNGSLVGTAQLNQSFNTVDQNVYAINGAGALGTTAITNDALAGNNIAAATSIVVQY